MREAREEAERISRDPNVKSYIVAALFAEWAAEDAEDIDKTMYKALSSSG
ncbi:MAG: hypothetical protein LBT14_02160 [Treponema sp.]|jgi:hypothetical protein|nr:hypothetical protein [Treponema sp.]